MNYLAFFQMPRHVKITGRSSSITNAFINAVIPVVEPTEKQVEKAFQILDLKPAPPKCVYCGETASEWDHLRPLVKNKKPTGFISEIHNLVPSCGKCNQSKGNKEWSQWIISDAKFSPKSKGVKDLNKRIEKLKEYEKWEKPTQLDFKRIAGGDLWSKHLENWNELLVNMQKSQELAEKIKQRIAEFHKVGKSHKGDR